MKQLNRILLLSLLAFAFAACSDDDDSKTPVEYDVISFEDAEGIVDLKSDKAMILGDVTMNLYTGETHTYREVFCAKEYVPAEDAFDALLFTTKDRTVHFGSYYANGFDNWGGFALSRNYNMTATTVDLKNQFSVWAKAGANGTKTCMVGYDSAWQDNSYALPIIEFTTPRKVDHLWMAPSTYAYAYTPSASVPAGETYYYKVVITGSLKGVEKGKVECLLVYGDKKTADWTKLSLAMLGEVDKLVFKPASNDMSNGYMNDPAYFCIDEIALVRK